MTTPIILVTSALVAVVLIGFAALSYFRLTKAYTPTTALDRAIATTIEALRGLPYEVEYVLDPHGEEILCVTQYDSSRVEFTAEQIAYLQQHPGTVGLHNHDEDVPPSLDDIALATNTAQAYLIVVSPRFLYTITPPTSGWKTVDELETVASHHLKLFRVTGVQQLNIHVGARGGEIEVCEFTELMSTDAAIRAVARDLGYTYRKERLK